MMRVNNTKRENSASSNSATAPTLLSAMQRQGLRGTPSWPRDLVLYAMVHSHTSWCQRHMLLWCQSVHKRAYPRLPTLNTLFHNGDRNEKVIGNLHPEPHHDQKLITSRGSPLAHFYHVWSTSFPHPWVILLTDTQTTERTVKLLHQPLQSNKIFNIAKIINMANQQLICATSTELTAKLIPQ